MSKVKRVLNLLLYCVFITIVFTFPLVQHLSDSVVDHGDPLLNSYILAWDSQAILNEPLNLFNARFFYPAKLTLTFSEHMLSRLIYFLPIYLFSNNPILSLNVTILITLILTGFFTYLYINHITTNKIAALFCATAMIIGIPKMNQIGHFQLIGIEWLPLSLYLFEKHLKNKSKLILLFLSVSVFLQLMTSYYLAYMFLIFYFLYTFFRIRSTNFYKDKNNLKVFLISQILTLSIFTFMTLPYLISKYSYGFNRGIGASIHYSADLFSYFSTSNFIFKDFNLWVPAAAIHEKILFPGFSIIILVILAFKSKSRFKRPLLFSTLALFILSLGPFLQVNNFNTYIPLPYILLYIIVPGFSSMRVPARFGIFVYYGLVFVSSLGIVRLLKYKYGKYIMPFIFFILFVFNFNYPYPGEKFELNESEIMAYNYIKGNSSAAVLELPVYREKPWLNTRYMIASLIHQKNIVNGYSGFFPASYNEILNNAIKENDFLDLAYLANIGVDTVIIHQDKIEGNIVLSKDYIDQDKDYMDQGKLHIQWDEDYIKEAIKYNDILILEISSKVD